MSTSEEENLLKKSHQKTKHYGCLPCNILKTILKMDKGGTQINEPKHKEADIYAQVFYIQEMTQTDSAPRKKNKEGDSTSIGNCVGIKDKIRIIKKD